jgi:hypothetical protein
MPASMTSPEYAFDPRRGALLQLSPRYNTLTPITLLEKTLE